MDDAFDNLFYPRRNQEARRSCGTNYIRITKPHSQAIAARCALVSTLALLYWFSNSGTRDNAGLERRAQTGTRDQPRMRDMLIARRLQAFVSPPRIVAGFQLHSPEPGSAALTRHEDHPNSKASFPTHSRALRLGAKSRAALLVFKFRDAG